jgi:hypothetical protein
MNQGPVLLMEEMAEMCRGHRTQSQVLLRSAVVLSPVFNSLFLFTLCSRLARAGTGIDPSAMLRRWS